MKSEQNSISRKDFIRKVGAVTAFAVLYACMGSCTKMDDPKIKGSAGSGALEDCYEIDLTDPSVVSAFQNDKYLIIDNAIVIALTGNGSYIATSRMCSHESFNQIEWEPINQEWYCTKHDATFDSSNGVENGHYVTVGATPLPIFSSSLIGNILTVCTV